MGGGAEREEAAEGAKGPTQALTELAKRNRAAAPAGIDGQGFMLHPAACVCEGGTCVALVVACCVLCVSCLAVASRGLDHRP